MKKDKIIIYKTKSKKIDLKVHLQNETVWLSLGQMSTLFDRDKSVVSRHISNIFKEGELKRKAVVAKFATTASDGKTYKVEYYNLDVIISVGYRVKSLQGTQFRIWATNTLRQYLINGYAINKKRLLEANKQLKNVRQTIKFLNNKSKKKLLQGQESEILNLISDYSKTLNLLEQYDNDKVTKAKGKKEKVVIKYQEATNIIGTLKAKNKKGLFGQEYKGKFDGVINCIYQTFAKKELYPTLEEKAANLLYLTIKDHPFADGNKRIGSFLFVYFLDKNNYLYKKDGEKKINDNALVTLALLIAESNPKEKDLIINIITNLLID